MSLAWHLWALCLQLPVPLCNLALMQARPWVQLCICVREGEGGGVQDRCKRQLVLSDDVGCLGVHGTSCLVGSQRARLAAVSLTVALSALQGAGVPRCQLA